MVHDWSATQRDMLQYEWNNNIAMSSCPSFSRNTKAEPETMSVEGYEADSYSEQSSPELRLGSSTSTSEAIESLRRKIDDITENADVDRNKMLEEIVDLCFTTVNDHVNPDQLAQLEQYTKEHVQREELLMEGETNSAFPIDTFDFADMAINSEFGSMTAPFSPLMGATPTWHSSSPVVSPMVGGNVSPLSTSFSNVDLDSFMSSQCVGNQGMHGLSLDSLQQPGQMGYNPMPYNPTCGLRLKHQELWTRLHGLKNEMIVSTKGRQLFPPIEVTVPELIPDQKYTAWLRFECEDPKGAGWRWAEQSGWQLVRKLRRTNSLLFHHNTSDHAQELYVLPGGPFTGEQIMKEGLSFAHAKITNKPNTKGAVYIESFHSYVPVVYLAPAPSDAGDHFQAVCPPHSSKNLHRTSESCGLNISCHPSEIKRYPLQLCSFIACTAYHNKELAQIKILANPQTRGTRVLGNITPHLAQEFVSGDLVGEAGIGKHKEQYLRRCMSVGSVMVPKSEMESASETSLGSDTHPMGTVMEGVELNGNSEYSPRSSRPMPLVSGGSSPSILQRRTFKRSTSLVRELHAHNQEMGLLRSPSTPCAMLGAVSPRCPRSPLSLAPMQPMFPSAAPASYGMSLGSMGSFPLADFGGPLAMSMPYGVSVKADIGKSEMNGFFSTLPELHQSPIVVRRYLVHKQEQ